MTHEFKEIISGFLLAKNKGFKCVLATVVALDGSSYRKPGVRMLIDSKMNMTGAVSGGCVEKEVCRQAVSVLETDMPKIMTYDGRYRLGCEGILYILIEPFDPSSEVISRFNSALKNRECFEIHSHYQKEISSNENYRSKILFGSEVYTFIDRHEVGFALQKMEKLIDVLKPSLQLLVIGAEHDAVQLVKIGAFLGWNVKVITQPTDEQVLADFPGADEIEYSLPEQFNGSNIIAPSAVVLMNHNFVKDLHFLEKLQDVEVFYIGILGPVKRREKLLNALIEKNILVKESFLEKIFSPAGLNIGAVTPQEIALSICAEIQAVQKKKEPSFLVSIKGKIHS
ncbi:XdhC family protein [Namhaeicola litoreus]|uniref:XdhC family protein n=1 Tax=Namhaeicola litoreus TaxID=1052145 RepID=A0ABW3Y343_9FLAO